MHEENRKFEPLKADRLISEERFNSLRPDLLLKEIGVKPGMNLADIGCGNGFFSVPATELVAPDGTVFAFDVSDEMLNKLRERSIPENIQILLSTENNFSVEANSVDFAILSFVIHEAENRGDILLEVRRILKNKGFLWILEWIPQEEENGPPQNHRVSQEELLEDLDKTGFQIEWSRTLGISHYHILSKK